MTTWYVRPSGGSYGTEDGTSYANAWDGFTNITWGSGGVIAGDVLYVAGSHTEQLTVGVTGSSGSLVTVRGDYPSDAGDIDAELTRAYGVYIAGKSFVKVMNITVANAENGANGEGVKVENCTSCELNNVSSTGCKWNQLQIDYSTDCTIINCTVSDGVAGSGKGISIAGDVSGPSVRCYAEGCTSTNAGTDNYVLSGLTATQTTTLCGFRNCVSSGAARYGFQIDLCSNVFVENCTSASETNSNIYHKDALNTLIQGCVLTGNAATDMVQVVGHSGLTCNGLQIVGNHFKDLAFNGYTIETIDLFVSDMTFSGNVVENCYRGIRAINNTGQRICNNTWIDTDECYRAQVTVNNGNAIISNNIFTGQNTANAQEFGYIYTQAASGNVFTIDNNSYNQATDVLTCVRYNGVSYNNTTVSTVDTNAVVVDPDFVDESGGDYTPQGSGLISSGILWDRHYLTVDLNGEPVPSIDIDIGSIQSTDAANHPFHPLNL